MYVCVWERDVFEFLSLWSVRTGKLFTSIFTKSSPAGTFLSDCKLVPNTEENKREKLPCYEYWSFVVMIGPYNIYWAQLKQHAKKNKSGTTVWWIFNIALFNRNFSTPIFSWRNAFFICFAVSMIILHISLGQILSMLISFENLIIANIIFSVVCLQSPLKSLENLLFNFLFYKFTL